MKVGRKPGWTEEHVEAIRKFAAKGYSRLDTAEAAGLSPAITRNIARSRGIKFRGKGGRRSAKTTWPAAKELAEQGKSLIEASEIMGMHWSSLLYISRKMGFAWPKAQPRPRIPYRRPARVERGEHRESSQKVERMMQLVDRLYAKRAA